MSSRGLSNKHALPSNPSFLEFEKSDGDSALWPHNTTKVVDAEGCVNFMQHVALDEPMSIKWRVGVGAAVSSILGLPAGPAYVLKDFPKGYRMFDHHKGKANSPRHDVYLFGSDSKARFRSVPEFIPHAIWLMSNGSDPCNCKYCTKRPQTVITASMGSHLRSTHSPSPSHPSPPRPSTFKKVERKKDILAKPRLADRLRDTKVYAAVQKSHKVLKVSHHVQAKSTMLVERNNSLRDAVRRPGEGRIQRWFRNAELVWCALETPITCDDADAIRFWPGVIDEVKLTVVSDPVPEGADPTTPWTSRQFTTYKVRLLAISRTYDFPDTMVIPYQSYAIPENILGKISHRPAGDWDLDFNDEMLAKFDPRPEPPTPIPTFDQAMTPFALALQIASSFSGYWCLTDDWEAKLSLPSPPRPIAPPSSLQSAIEFAGMHNANTGSISTGPNPKAPPAFRTVTQTRFQGLWWGGERIWAEDFIRLKVPRSCLAPAGAPNIFAPSGPGPKSKALAESQGNDPALYGAISRGVFMRADVIFIVDSTSGTSMKRECRVSGMLYELADEDWEDPNLPRNFDSISISASSAPRQARDPTPGRQSSKSPGPPSSPATSSFALPAPPMGFKFRPILPPGFEIALSLSLVSGRYYPGILRHPLMKPHLNEVIPGDPNTMMNYRHLWALEGLFGGYGNAVDPTRYMADRKAMMDAATKDAMEGLKGHIMDRHNEPQAVDKMDVDSDMPAA